MAAFLATGVLRAGRRQSGSEAVCGKVGGGLAVRQCAGRSAAWQCIGVRAGRARGGSGGLAERRTARTDERAGGAASLRGGGRRRCGAAAVACVRDAAAVACVRDAAAAAGVASATATAGWRARRRESAKAADLRARRRCFRN